MSTTPVGSGRLWLPVAIATLAAAAAAPGEIRAQAGRAETREGNRLYEEGRFAEAHEKYLEALLEAPDSPIIRFNDGNALYRGENYESALESFRAAVESGDPALAGAAWYNLGNTLYRQGALPESLEAFKQALRADPSDADAKHNLERVLEQMQEQQQQQQGEGESDEENDEENEDEGEGEPQPQDGEQDPDPEQDPQNQPEQEPEPNPDESEPQEGTPPPGEMTREEAERLLDAIREDQDEVNRQPRTPTRGTRPRRDW
ncbi:MAG: tetratricopeptide repeat protein [Gemmatimonadales bacterium]|nr:tetratricopeptide repeat protein [Gemmatimonadales bacterium]MYG49689.1 tetratricopeptide repeat protein [Gemmatimonadales bacterium]MYK01911.1 tetratricopeptide repeat protein [Candidatus Palauibacter ramosifaciens]